MIQSSVVSHSLNLVQIAIGQLATPTSTDHRQPHGLAHLSTSLCVGAEFDKAFVPVDVRALTWMALRLFEC